ncbi:MAG: DinB family protein [Planctomycetes bacterium]|nr:DinB family protein [Planctomycetota bacterium]
MDEREAIEKLVRAERIVRGALPEDDEVLRRAAVPGRWSPAEHALHCALVFEVQAEAFARALAAAPLGPPPEDLLKSLARRAVLLTWRIPGRPEAPERMKPPVILGREELLETLVEARDRLIDLCGLVDRPRRELWVEHPALGAMSFAESVSFILVHAQHHARLMKKGS